MRPVSTQHGIRTAVSNPIRSSRNRARSPIRHAPERRPARGTGPVGDEKHALALKYETSFYGPGLYGGKTACGHDYTKQLVGVAHRTLPCGTRVSFRNPANGRVVTTQVIDRGPYVAGRTWDLSGGLCLKLDHCYTGPFELAIRGRLIRARLSPS